MGKIINIFWLLLFFETTLNLNATGVKTNRFYTMRHYYGSRDKEFLVVKTITDDELTVVKWTKIFDWNFEYFLAFSYPLVKLK